jgi:hypothetical protein
MRKRGCLCAKNWGEAAHFSTQTKENFSSLALYKPEEQL